MKTNTFILIVSAYSILLSLPAIFTPGLAIEYFGGTVGDMNEHASINFIGGYQLAMGYLGFITYRSTDRAVRRGWLLAVAFLTLFAIAVFLFNLNVRNLPPTKTFYFDMAFWACMAVGALYFRSKE
jgi:hypothetical protein